MLKAEIDKPKNLLKVAYSGTVGVQEMERCLEQLALLVAGLSTGFRLLTDLSGLEAMGLDCVPFVKRMMDLCNKKGIDTVVRVIPDPSKDIGLNILSLFHYRRRVRIVTCKTLAEAMKVLG